MKAVNVDEVLKILHRYGEYIFVTDEKRYTDMVYEIANLKSLEQEPKWIPFSERLPEEETDVLICNEKGNIEVSRGIVFDDGTWEWYTSGWHFGEVLAWMPLPEPYKVESEDQNG